MVRRRLSVYFALVLVYCVLHLLFIHIFFSQVVTLSTTTSQLTPPDDPSLQYDVQTETPFFPTLQTNDTIFNYTAFWEEAYAAALRAVHDDTSSSISSSFSRPCPKVYVYDLPDSLTDSDLQNVTAATMNDDETSLPFWHWFRSQNEAITSKQQQQQQREAILTHVFGPKLGNLQPPQFYGLVRQTHQHSFALILEYRLRTSPQCRTYDPQRADLFLVPLLTKQKDAKKWAKQCKKIASDTVLTALSHLNSTNACRHFFAFGKGHHAALGCKGWFAEPPPALRPAQRLAYSHFDFQRQRGVGQPRHGRAPYNVTQHTYPHLMSVPYPSSLHYTTAPSKKSDSSLLLPQWQQPRTTLMSFLGKDTHGDKAVRQRIRDQCASYASSLANHANDNNNNNNNKYCQTGPFRPEHVVDKSRAVFCLEPAGDSPWRKSLADSLTMGCVPVLFSELTDDVAPWHWGTWKAAARVLVPQTKFAQGEVDLRMLLQSIPPGLLRLMQGTLQRRARRFQYSVYDDVEDGVGVILEGLYRRALDMERRGVCGSAA